MKLRLSVPIVARPSGHGQIGEVVEVVRRARDWFRGQLSPYLDPAAWAGNGPDEAAFVACIDLGKCQSQQGKAFIGYVECSASGVVCSIEVGVW
jgi:hypothetical protein